MIENTQKKSHVIVGLSGGVDSAVSAYLLKKSGHEVEAIFMKNWEDDDAAHCPFTQDFIDAQKVCEKLTIPLKLVNFSDDYWTHVFSYFLDEYRASRTPNPDILCNKEIKFKAFLNYAKQNGADFIATGHYVRKFESQQKTYLLKGSDALKDQSYFLYALNEMQLAQSLFPVGALTKSAVREIAKDIGLANHAKKDSTGICFIGERKFKQFLNEYLPAKPGNIETLAGEIVGQHDGLMFYTLGQRQGLHIGGKKGKQEAPWYVAHKDVTRNVLVVVQGDHPALYRTTLIATQLHWIHDAPSLPFKTQAKTRYRQADQLCLIEPFENNRVQVTFEQPQRAITPGQSIVFYQDTICLGGGIIEN